MVFEQTRISGTIPHEAPACNYDTINMASTELSGTIPDLSSGFKMLKGLFWSYTSISGTLSDMFQTDIYTLELAGIPMSGSLPTTVARLERLDFLDIVGTRMSGSLPELRLSSVDSINSRTRFQWTSTVVSTL
jgi:hypothetical protein